MGGALAGLAREGGCDQRGTEALSCSVFILSPGTPLPWETGTWPSMTRDTRTPYPGSQPSQKILWPRQPIPQHPIPVAKNLLFPEAFAICVTIFSIPSKPRAPPSQEPHTPSRNTA